MINTYLHAHINDKHISTRTRARARTLGILHDPKWACFIFLRLQEVHQSIIVQFYHVATHLDV